LLFHLSESDENIWANFALHSPLCTLIIIQVSAENR
jgi:hypothetical protein